MTVVAKPYALMAGVGTERLAFLGVVYAFYTFYSPGCQDFGFLWCAVWFLLVSCDALTMLSPKQKIKGTLKKL